MFNRFLYVYRIGYVLIPHATRSSSFQSFAGKDTRWLNSWRNGTWTNIAHRNRWFTVWRFTRENHSKFGDSPLTPSILRKGKFFVFERDWFLGPVLVGILSSSSIVALQNPMMSKWYFCWNGVFQVSQSERIFWIHEWIFWIKEYNL